MFTYKVTYSFKGSVDSKFIQADDKAQAMAKLAYILPGARILQAYTMPNTKLVVEGKDNSRFDVKLPPNVIVVDFINKKRSA